MTQHDRIMAELEQQGFTPKELAELDKLVDHYEPETESCGDSI